jgi:hypothetical protein
VWRPDWLPFLRSSPCVLRLGQAHFQLWRVNGLRLELLASRPSGHIRYNDYQAIANELAMLSNGLPAGASVQLLADSKWMPLSLLVTGRAPLSGAQVQALAKHRLVDVFGEQAQTWGVQTNYVGGDMQALAFACPDGLLASVQQSPLQIQSMQPTFCWAWNQVWCHEGTKADKWLVFAEHDRTVMARMANGRLLAFQPAGPLVTSPAQLATALPIHALRCGLDETDHTALGISLEPRADMTQVSPTAGVRWHAVGTTEALA